MKIFKKIRRQGYRRTRGHRQTESVLRVTAIAADGKEAKWDGVVDLTTKAELNARSRNLKLDFAPVPTAAPVEAAAEAPKPKRSAVRRQQAEAQAQAAETEAAPAVETKDTDAE